MTFKSLPEHELYALPDEELIAYLVAARNALRLDHARKALSYFVFRRRDDLIGKALTKMGNRDDAEELADQTIEDTIRAAFEGSSPGEAASLMWTILARRIADFYKRLESRPVPDQLPEDRDEEDRKGPDAAVSKDDKGIVGTQDAIERVLAGYSPHHMRVVELRCFERYASKETAARVNEEFPKLDTPMTAANVDQIASRFRTALRGELDEDG
jgi:DNA-directed RNA polymerase specialized sigma24 family protein